MTTADSRSRRRFWHGEPDALATLHTCVETLSRLMAPFTPFTSDYENILLSISLIGDWNEFMNFPEQGTIIARAIDQGVHGRPIAADARTTM